MRVVHVIGGSELGGSRQHVLALCRGLDARPEIDARLVCLLDGPVAASAREQGVACTVLGMRGPTDLRAVARLRRHLRNSGPDIVHTHGVRANFVGRLAARGLAVPLVTTVHSSVNSDYANPFKRVVYPVLERRTRGSSERFIAVSTSLADELARDGVPAERIAVVHNCLDELSLSMRCSTSKLREELGIPVDVPVVISVGRLEAVKGPATLLQILSALRERIRFHAVIVGSGSLEATVRRMATDLGLDGCLTFLGFRRDAAQLIDQADVMVVASQMEGTSHAVLEAMRGRTPVVASDVGGNRDIVGLANNGFLVPQGDIEGYAHHVECLLRRPDLATRLADAGVEALDRHFSLEPFIEKTIAQYDLVLGRRHIGSDGPGPRVAIAGYFGAGNLGDEAILAGLLATLRVEKITDCTALSFDPVATHRTHGVRSLYVGRRLGGLLRTFCSLRGADLLILAGGLLQDGHARVVPFWLSRAFVARLTGVPVLYYGLGVGPLNTRAARWLVGAMPRRCTTISVRDEESARLLRDCGVRRPPIEVLADPSLCLAPDVTGSAGRENRSEGRADALTLAVCLRPSDQSAAFASAMVECLLALCRDRPIRYVFAPLHAREDPSVCDAISERIATTAGVRSKPAIACLDSPHAFTALLQDIDAVVSMRLHALILAARNAVPVFGIVADPKIQHFMDRLGTGDDTAGVADVCRRPRDVADRLAAWLDERHERSARTSVAIEEMARAAHRGGRIARALVRPSEVRILGQRIDIVTLTDAVDRISRAVAAGRRQFVIAHNPEKIIRSLDDPELAQIIESAATLVTADGIGLVVAARLLGLGRMPRTTGIDLFRALLAEAEAHGRSVFLYGAKPEVAERAADVVRRAHPSLVLAGAEHGYQRDEEEVLARIRAARPDYLFVALGTPAQEKWIARHLDDLPVRCAMGVGGGFDVVAGAVSRAPSLMQRTGTEWMFRLVQQPTRAGRMRAIPRFMWRVLRSRYES